MGFDFEALLRERGYVITGDRAVRAQPHQVRLPEVFEDPLPAPATGPPLVLTLPYPPSLNHLYVPVGWGKLVLSQAGRDYHEAVAIAVRQQYPALALMTGRLAVTLVMHAPDHRRRDTDGVEKVTWDALQAAGVYLDDEQIDARHVYRGAVQQPGHVHITLAEIQHSLPDSP